MITSPLLRSGRAEAQVLASEVECLRETQEGRRLLLLEAGVLSAHCRQYPDAARRQWELFHQEAEGRVLFPDDMASACVVLISLTEVYQQTVAAVRKGLEEAERFRPQIEAEEEQAYPAPDLSPFNSATEQLAALRSEITALWERGKTPPVRRRPLRTTEEIRAGRLRGEYISVEEAMSQVTENRPEAP